jgi:GNAT superfamily N-acetyltransferase
LFNPSISDQRFRVDRSAFEQRSGALPRRTHASTIGETDLDSRSHLSRFTGETHQRRRNTWFVAAAVPAGECLVHVDSVGDIDGFVVTNRWSFFDRDFVRLVSVDSSRRRSGIAGALLKAVVAGATSETVFISTNVSNSAMRELRRKDGWIFSGTLSGLDEGDPEVVFWKSKTTPQISDEQNAETRDVCE